jgi:CBS domain-containing protein
MPDKPDLKEQRKRQDAKIRERLRRIEHKLLVMTATPITVDVATPLNDVVKIMKEKNIIRLPVTENGKLVGIVARCDILTTLIEPEFVTYM